MRALVALCSLLLLAPSPATALPDFYNTAASSADFAVFAIYRDHADPNMFWIPYDRLQLLKDSSGKFMLSVAHWGITSVDVDGSGANLVFTAQPAISDDKFRAAVQAIRVQNPDAEFAPLPIISSEYEVLLDDRFVYGESAELQSKAQKSAVEEPVVLTGISSGEVLPVSGAAELSVSDADRRDPVAGGAGAGPQAFSLQLERLGGRVLASAGEGGGGNGFALRYTYKVMGVGPRLHARITVRWKRVLQHFQFDSSASVYFGAISSNMRLAYQNLKESGAITVEVLEAGVSEEDALDAYVSELYKLLAAAYVNGTGLFKPELRPVDAPGAPKGAVPGVGGWGVSSSFLAQQISEELESVFEINKAQTTEQEFSVGMSLGSSCESGEATFVNVTDAGSPCIKAQTVSAYFERINACLLEANSYADQLAAAGVATETVQKTRQLYTQVCMR